MIYVWLYFIFIFFSQRRKLGDDEDTDEVDGPKAIDQIPTDAKHPIATDLNDDDNDKYDIKVLAPNADGLVREMKTQKVISREQVQERTETEDVKHFGDFTDEVSTFFFLLICYFSILLFF